MKAASFALAALGLLLSGGLAPIASAADLMGEFTGASGHVTKGVVTITQQDGKTVAVLEDDFWFDGAPDPQLGFGNSGDYDKQSTFAKLQSNTGRQVYEIPASVDVAQYDEFYVWCVRFSVPLGVASIR